MTAASPWLRPLQVLVVVLGIAIGFLFVAWLRLEPLAPPPSPTNDLREVAERDAVDATTVDQGASGAAAAVAPAPAIAPPDSGSTAVLYGVVTHADGSLVTSGVFWLYRDGTHVGTQSLSDGRFAFAGLQAGVHRLVSRIDDELPLDREVAVVAPVTRLDIELPARWLLTVNAVTPDGAALLETVEKNNKGGFLRGIGACATIEPLPGDLPLSNFSEIPGVGQFAGNEPWLRRKTLPKETVGVLTLPADQPVSVALLLRNHVIAQMPATPGQESITFTLGSEAFLAGFATVHVRVVEPDGTPVAGARVALTDAQTGSSGTETDAEGRVTLPHVMPGRLDLRISHTDLCAAPVQIDVLPGADLDLGEVTMLPAVAVELAMDDFGGKGHVRFNCLDAPRAGWAPEAAYVSNESFKTYPLRLFPGRYGMLASGPNGVALVEIDVHAAPTAPIHFDLRPGATLRIDTRVGAGFARMEVASVSGVIVRRRG